MKKLHFDYYMQICYTQPARECNFTIKCIPQGNARQKISNVEITLFPENRYTENTDSFGNQLIYGHVLEAHEEFSFHITGEAAVGLADYEEAEKEERTSIFRYPHGLNTPGEAIAAYYGQLESSLPQTSVYDTGVALMQALYRDFQYEKNCTSTSTTAEEAWQLGKGVCQDYAHILIALCQMAGIPARYVTGMLIGEGYSHAWVEILDRGRWYGIDPTNNQVVTDSHIKIGAGRDAGDCMINRGIMLGGGSQVQNICVSVEEC